MFRSRNATQALSNESNGGIKSPQYANKIAVQAKISENVCVVEHKVKNTCDKNGDLRATTLAMNDDNGFVCVVFGSLSFGRRTHESILRRLTSGLLCANCRQ